MAEPAAARRVPTATTDPVSPGDPRPTGYKVHALELNASHGTVRVQVVASTGEILSFTYGGAAGAAMLQTLNTANLSVKSLQRRVLERLIADGALVGTITGTP